eukprot:g1422.t1
MATTAEESAGEIADLVRLRTNARVLGDFAEADAIRNSLLWRGILVEDLSETETRVQKMPVSIAEITTGRGCMCWMRRKGAFCGARVEKEEWYCAAHSKSHKGRVPCPLDPKHSVAIAKLPGHLRVCQRRTPDLDADIRLASRRQQQQEHLTTAAAAKARGRVGATSTNSCSGLEVDVGLAHKVLSALWECGALHATGAGSDEPELESRLEPEPRPGPEPRLEPEPAQRSRDPRDGGGDDDGEFDIDTIVSYCFEATAPPGCACANARWRELGLRSGCRLRLCVRPLEVPVPACFAGMLDGASKHAGRKARNAHHDVLQQASVVGHLHRAGWVPLAHCASSTPLSPAPVPPGPGGGGGDQDGGSGGAGGEPDGGGEGEAEGGGEDEGESEGGCGGTGDGEGKGGGEAEDEAKSRGEREGEGEAGGGAGGRGGINAPATSSVCLVEFGAGSAHLSHAVSAFARDPIAMHVLVDRQLVRKKADCRLRARGAHLTRVHADIADFDMCAVLRGVRAGMRSEALQAKGDQDDQNGGPGPAVTNADGGGQVAAAADAPPPAAVVAVGKHLCGAATDLSLQSCVAAVGALEPPACFRGAAFALCCHHRCTWSQYLGRAWLLTHGIAEAEFTRMCRMTRLAHSQYRQRRKPGAPTARARAAAARAELGHLCKRLLDEGRSAWLREQGWRSRSVRFVLRETSPENVLLLAWPAAGGGAAGTGAEGELYE